MERIHITLTMAVAGLLSVVKEYGYGHVAGSGNDGCVYGTIDHETGFLSPVCIVGAYFANLGLLRALLSGNDGCWYGSFGENEALFQQLGECGVTMDDDVVDLFTEAQTEQDNGSEWGRAVTVAVERAQRKQAAKDPLVLATHALATEYQRSLV